uniref:ATP synthase subunit a n=1 Tax=Lepidotrigona flavibasis TaxID=2696055 RepID=A0A6B9MZT9_9HYME|nr:ATP synthase F0 subunit 6 [Lepidotrigona flavibasis]
MWTNLFESFDPSIYYLYKFQFNWLFLILPAIAMYNTYWFIPSRLGCIINLMLSLMYKEFSLSIGKNSMNSNIIIFMGTMFYLMFLNFFSLFPYIFPSTSHFMINLSISLTLWLGMSIYSMYNYPISFLSHLVPYNSPKPLMNFMVIIELISYMIRPMTLSIRLSSNLISGHLILILLSSFMMNFLIVSPLSMMVQDILLILEICMSIIQAYVYSVLLTLYLSESS